MAIRNALGLGCLVVALPLLLLLSPLIVLILAWEEYRSRLLRRRFQRVHGADKRGILVYSNSPTWQRYIEQEWVPRVEGRLLILNWSERSRWDAEHPLEASIFRSQLGDRDFNPAAIIFLQYPPGATYRAWLTALRKRELIGILAPHLPQVATVRFFRAFRDFKHGRDHALKVAEAKLWAYLEPQ